jgi:ketosteroid isomerase-like protein
MQPALDTHQAEVWEFIRQFNQSFAANNPDLYFSFIDPSITVIVPGNPYRIDGIEHDREEFEFGVKKGYSRIGFFQELQPAISVYGDVAVVTYYSRGSYGPEENARTLYLKETDVLVNRNGDWKIVHIHVSSAT